MVRKGTVEEIVAILPFIPEFKDPYPAAEFHNRLDANPSLILL